MTEWERIATDFGAASLIIAFLSTLSLIGVDKWQNEKENKRFQMNAIFVFLFYVVYYLTDSIIWIFYSASDNYITGNITIKHPVMLTIVGPIFLVWSSIIVFIYRDKFSFKNIGKAFSKKNKKKKKDGSQKE